MEKRKSKEEKLTDVKGTVSGFVSPDPVEKSQEEEIQEFKLEKQNEREIAKLSEEEQKAKRKQYEEEEERLEKVKTELLISIRERIPAIEKKFKQIVAPLKSGKVVEKVRGKSKQREMQKEEKKQIEEKSAEKERE